jgi:hypothetical protein
MAPPLLFVALILGVLLIVVYTHTLEARREQFIREFALPPGLYEKLREKHPHLSLKDCQLVGHALRQFFLAYLKSRRQEIAMPSQVVDDLWHEFILYTHAYAQFTRRAFGRFLHHVPAAVFAQSQSKDDGLMRCWYQACREEHVNPRKASRLPLLFAIDRKLQIKGGFVYALDCGNEAEVTKIGKFAADAGAKVHCAANLRPLKKSDGGSGCGGGSCATGSGSSCGGGCGGD